MKKLLMYALLAVLSVTFTSIGSSEAKTASGKPAPAVKTYKIGDKGPAGGCIFYDKGSVSDGWRYLEAAPADASASAEWGCMGKATGASGTAVGTGKSNTLVILKSCTQAGTAAKLSANYRGGGKNDWFLPSLEEIILIANNLYNTPYKLNTSRDYWTSSEGDAGKAVFYSGGMGINGPTVKNMKYAVRAIRAF